LPHLHSREGRRHNDAKDPHTAFSPVHHMQQTFLPPDRSEGICDTTRRGGGFSLPGNQVGAGMHVRQGYDASVSFAQTARAPTVRTQTAQAQAASPHLAQPQIRRADVPRVLEPGTTTLMVRNIPARYNQSRLLEEWPPNGSYDFFYLPSNRKGFSRGYAFLNFVTPRHALQFQQRWHGSRLSNHGTSKHLDVSAARAQGRTENLRDILGGADWATWSQNASTEPLVFDGIQQLDTESVILQLGLNTPQ